MRIPAAIIFNKARLMRVSLAILLIIGFLFLFAWLGLLPCCRRCFRHKYKTVKTEEQESAVVKDEVRRNFRVSIQVCDQFTISSYRNRSIPRPTRRRTIPRRSLSRTMRPTVMIPSSRICRSRLAHQTLLSRHPRVDFPVLKLTLRCISVHTSTTHIRRAIRPACSTVATSSLLV